MNKELREEVASAIRNNIVVHMHTSGEFADYELDDVEQTADRILAIPAIAERDCPDCGGTGYGGHGPHIEFCTCTAGDMAFAFHEIAPDAYLRWVCAKSDN